MLAAFLIAPIGRPRPSDYRSLTRAGERGSARCAFSAAAWSWGRVSPWSPTPGPGDLPPKGFRTRDIYVRELHIDSIKLKAQDFR